jgi:hypothetical protein
MKQRLFAITLLLAASPAFADIVSGWYSGDPDFAGQAPGVRNIVTRCGGNLTACELSSSGLTLDSILRSYVYENFIVPDGGWTVVGLFSNNSLGLGGGFFEVTEAEWEIRTGLSEGNRGTLIARGRTESHPNMVTPIPIPGWPPEYEVFATGLNIHLDPGAYWMSLTPAVTTPYPALPTWDASRILTTSGINGIGTSGGNGSRAFVWQDWGGVYEDFFDPAARYGPGYASFSAGVLVEDAASVPEPGALWLLIPVQFALVFFAVRHRRELELAAAPAADQGADHGR